MLEQVKQEPSIGAEGPPKFRKLKHNALDGFNNGATLDLRVRFAMELLKSPIFHNHAFISSRERVPGGDPLEIVTTGSAIVALDIATELFDEADRRGLIESLDEYDNDEHLKQHIRRQAHFQAELNMSVQREAKKIQDNELKLAKAVGGAFGKQ